MNFLAHAFLAGDGSGDRCGGVAGDFVKGLLPAGLPPALAAGVALHRKIDVFADSHPAFLRSRARVSASRRRVAGVMVDLFYDHFLAVHWERFSGESLPQFAANLYAELDLVAVHLPARFAEVLVYMRRDDWLVAYRDPQAIALALDRMAVHRLRRPNTLTGGGDELLANYAGFEADCLEFLPDAQRYAGEVRRVRAE